MAFVLWILTASWASVIFYFSSMTGSNVASIMPDYVPHFVEYAILTILLTAAITATNKQMPAGLVGLWAICIISIYAVSDEFHQSFVPGRTPDLRDWAVDVLAAVVMASFFFLFKARPSRK